MLKTVADVGRDYQKIANFAQIFFNFTPHHVAMTIIGIAGGTGSGKTTVVKKIAEVLPPHCAAIVPLS